MAPDDATGAEVSFWSRIVCPECGFVMMHCTCGMAFKLKYLEVTQQSLDKDQKKALYTNRWELYE